MSNVLDFMVNGIVPSKVGGTGTTVKYFPRPLPGWGNVGAGGPGVAFPATPSSTSAIGALFLPAQNVYQGQQLDILVTGTFGSDTGDPSGTVTVQLYGVTGTTSVPVFTSIATTGAMTPTFASAQDWGIQATLMGSTASGQLIGAYQAYKNGSVTAPTTVTTILTGLNFNLGNPALQQGAVLGFAVGVTFGTSDATNTASLFEFTIES